METFAHEQIRAFGSHDVSRRSTFQRLARVALVMSAALVNVARPGFAQDERSLTKQVPWSWSQNLPASDLKLIIDKGFRLIDLEVAQTSPLQFSAVFVKNEGVYGKAWWWYTSLSGPEVDQKLKEHNARLLDIEVVSLKPDARFAVVLVSNEGNQAKTSNWTAGSVELNALGTYTAGLLKAGLRLIDFDPNRHLAGYTTTVELQNTGAGATAWWYYVNVTPEFITSKLKEHQARLTDIERHPGGQVSAIMVKSQGETWWWYLGRTAAQVDTLANKSETRVIDIETHLGGGERRFDVILLENKKP